MTAILYHRRNTGLHRHDGSLQRRIAGVIWHVVSLQWLNASLQRRAADLQWHDASILRGKSSVQCDIGRLHWTSARVRHAGALPQRQSRYGGGI